MITHTGARRRESEMSLLDRLFGKTPFGPLVEHTRKVHECVRLVKPLAEAIINEEYEKIHGLQDEVSRLEYEADKIKHAIREEPPRRVFMPVEKEDFYEFLSCQDKIADGVEDFAVVLLIRHTKVHKDLSGELLEFVDQVIKVSETLLSAGEHLLDLVETAFGGAEAEAVLKQIRLLGEEEWRADRMQRKFSVHLYEIEDQLDPMTIVFYEKMLHTLSSIANAAENAGDQLRQMIIKD